MSKQDDLSESEWAAKYEVTIVPVPANKKKFNEKWIDIFKPWLQRDTLDPDIPYCKACNCRVSSSSKFFIQRHARTPKHNSNLDIYLNSIKTHSKQKIFENKKQNQPTTTTPDIENYNSNFNDSIDEEELIENDDSMQIAQNFLESEKQGSSNRSYNSDTNCTPNPIKVSSSSRETDEIERKNLLLKIQQDRQDLLSTFNNIFLPHTANSKKKDHVDLFFDSVSESVKAFSPTLIAEMKLRVSQLVCELELRFIKEKENNSTGEREVILEVSNGNNTFLIDYNQVDSSFPNN